MRKQTSREGLQVFVRGPQAARETSRCDSRAAERTLLGVPFVFLALMCAPQRSGNRRGVHAASFRHSSRLMGRLSRPGHVLCRRNKPESNAARLHRGAKGTSAGHHENTLGGGEEPPAREMKKGGARRSYSYRCSVRSIIHT